MRTLRRINFDGTPGIECITHFPHRTPLVWEAAIEPEGMSKWFPAKVAYDPVPGSKITFSGDPHMPDSTGVILDYEAGRRIAFSWGNHEVLIVLTPVEGSTDLVLIDRLAHENEAARTAAGWHERLGILDRSLDVSTPVQPWSDLYAYYVQAGFPTGAPVPSAATSGAEHGAW